MHKYSLIESSYMHACVTPCTLLLPAVAGAYYSTERNGTPDSAKYLFCGTHRNGPKTASQLSGYYIEMYPKLVALIS